MGIVRIHHPILTADEKEKRMKKIKEATIVFFQEVEREKKSASKQLKAI